MVAQGKRLRGGEPGRTEARAANAEQEHRQHEGWDNSQPSCVGSGLL